MSLQQEPPGAWRVVWACFTALAVIFGVSYSFAAFFQSFADEFQVQRAEVSLVFGLSGAVYFLVGPLGGWLADRFGPQRVTSAGIVCIAAGLLVGSFASSIGMVYLAYAGGVGVGIALVYTPAIGCVQPWFTTRRGLAAGVASAGLGAGTLVVPLLVALAIDALLWRDAMRVTAVAVLGLGLVAAFSLQRAPSARANAGQAVAGLSLRQALKTPQFAWLFAGTVLASPTMFIPFAHASAAARDLGVNEASAVGLVGAIGLGSLTGRFAIGALADRLGRARTLVLAQAAMGLSYALWLNASGYAGMVSFAVCLGLAYGGIVSLLPALCMDYFGARAVSSIIGTLYSGAALGNLFGPWAAGQVFDRTGSYATLIWGCMLLSALATLVTVMLARSGHPK
jgi:MFS family permease